MSENSVENEVVRRRPRWLVPLVAGVCVIALAGGVTGGVIAWRDDNARASADAQSRCECSLAKVDEARKAHAKMVESAGGMKAVKAEQVADALASELDAKAPKTLACDATDADGLNATSDRLVSQAKWYAKHEQSVKTASENVSKSRDEKTPNDARKALADKESAARKLLKDSDSKTSDNVARAQLTQAINTAVEAGKGSQTVSKWIQGVCGARMTQMGRNPLATRQNALWC
ncbi:hypothetical protein ACE15Y_06880 [Bifidobacterium bifidum]|uniref:hypothetical protein n=1 Tax=Bifidobacterium bifidum TaxID=1681 RepID=UPI003D006F54